MEAKKIRKIKVLTEELLRDLVNQVHPLRIEKVGDDDLKITKITDMTGLQTSHYMLMDLITEDNKAAIAALPSDTIVPVGPVYTLNYTSDQATAPDSKPIQSMADGNYTLTEEDLPELSEENYVFGGWSINGKKVTAGDKISSNVSLVAIWYPYIAVSYVTDPEDLTVVGLPDDGTLIPSESGTYELTAEDLPSDVLADGYELEGYYLNDSPIAIGDLISGESVVITAKFIEE